MTLLDDSGLQVKPEGTVSVSEIVPPNPLTAVRLMVEVADDPGVTVLGDVATTRKSWKLKIAVVGCTRPPLVPVMTRT